MGVRGAQAGVRADAGKRAVSLAKRREMFLEHFAVNCHVEAAAAAADIALPTLYQWRRREPAFATQWAEAMAAGYQMLEARLVAHALAGDSGERLEGVEGTPVAPVNVDVALKLIALRQRPGPKRIGRPPIKTVSSEDTLKVLLKRLDLIEKRKRDEAARLTDKSKPVPLVIEHQDAGKTR